MRGVCIIVFSRGRIAAWLATVLAATVLVAGCGGLSSSGPPAQGGSLAQQVSLEGQSYIVGGKNFDEQLVLCHITVAAESVNANVSDQCNLGGRDATRNALLGGDIDLYWEYTGTAWVSFLTQQPIQDSPTQYEAAKTRDLEAYS